MKLFRAFTIAVTATTIAGTAYAQTAGVGTGPATSLTGRLGTSVAKVMVEQASINMLAQPYDGNQQHLGLTNSGDLAFSLNNIQEIRAAVNGTEQFDGKGFPNMRIAARLISIPVGLFVRSDSGINKISDLTGKKVPVGYGSQATVRNVITALLGAGGLSQGDIAGIEVPNTGGGAAAFREGRVDVMMSSVGGRRLIQANEAVGGIKLLEIPNDPAAEAALQKAFPGAYIITTKPRKGLPGVDAPMRTMAYDFLINASTETDDDLVYNLVKTLAENKEALIATGVPQFRSFSKDTMARQYDDVEYHPGAIRYYKEIGVWTGS